MNDNELNFDGIKTAIISAKLITTLAKLQRLTLTKSQQNKLVRINKRVADLLNEIEHGGKDNQVNIKRKGV